MTKSKERVTIADVAREADVSSMTVSRVLNNKDGISEETREHVLAVMNELDYRPNRVARSLATDKTLKIGIVIPSLSSAYFGAILEGAERIFWEHGYHMLLCNTGNIIRHEQAVLDLFEEDRVDGVLAFSSQLSGEQLASYLRNQRAAVVLNAEIDPDVAGHILIDETASMALAVNHLWQNGRHRLGYIGVGGDNYAKRERARSFQRTLEAAGQSVEPAHIVENCGRGYGALTQLICEHPDIDGIICFNDEVAARVLRVCADLGRRVPDDVAVVGYDDIFLAELLTPTLTTLRLSLTKHEVGAMAARMLLARIEGETHQNPVILSHELVIRDSAP